MDALGIDRAILAGYDWGGRGACVARPSPWTARRADPPFPPPAQTSPEGHEGPAHYRRGNPRSPARRGPAGERLVRATAVLEIRAEIRPGTGR